MSDPENTSDVPDPNTAYTALNELFEKGQITGSQAAELRAVYGRMEADLNHMIQVERDLINRAKNYTIEIEDQEKQLTLDSDADSGAEELSNEDVPVSAAGPQEAAEGKEGSVLDTGGPGESIENLKISRP